jgi:hypothetical protein
MVAVTIGHVNRERRPRSTRVDFNHRCGDIRHAFSDVGGHVILGPKLFWF